MKTNLVLKYIADILDNYVRSKPNTIFGHTECKWYTSELSKYKLRKFELKYRASGLKVDLEIFKKCSD